MKWKNKIFKRLNYFLYSSVFFCWEGRILKDEKLTKEQKKMIKQVMKKNSIELSFPVTKQKKKTRKDREER